MSTLVPQAFDTELVALAPRLRSYARRLSRHGDVAEDLVQETLLKAWAARERFQPGTNLRAWTFTILRNVFLSQCRRGRFNVALDELEADRRLSTPETQTKTIELAEVRRALSQLTEDQRNALFLVAVDGLSYEEASQRAGISLASLKSRVMRARISLQAILSGIRTAPSASGRPVVDRKNAWPAAKAAGRELWIGRELAAPTEVICAIGVVA